MKIKTITLNNFKVFEGEHMIDTNSEIVCLVGENNVGKTTIFSAVDFLKNGVAKDKSIDGYKNKNKLINDVSVEITIEGRLKEAILNFSEEKFLPYIVENGCVEIIRLKRSSEKSEITQNKKSIQLNENKITVFNPETNQFENPAGFDRAIGSLFETQFIWSDMKSDDIVDFGSTKTLGKLLKEVSDGFQESQEWLNFKDAHQRAFVTSDNALSKQSEKIRNEIQNSLCDFYGKAEIQFSFQSPDPLSFIKLGDVFVDDGVNTSITEKGSGMQRALALSVIKVYADFLSKHKENEELSKPFFFFIDEPEISLHPKAQSILVKALGEIAKRQQVFVTTHSPYFLKSFGVNKNAIRVVCRDGGVSVRPAEEAETFDFSPTLAEINYFAYNLATPDFHNELYGFISKTTKNFTSSKLDQWFIDNYEIYKDKKWARDKNRQQQNLEDVTLMTYIRHSIHHPENKVNLAFTEQELDDSIKKMLSVIQSKVFSELREVIVDF